MQKRFDRVFLSLMHISHQFVLRSTYSSGINLHEMWILMILKHRGPMTIKQLRKQIHLAQSSLSEVISNIERKKFLQKMKDPDDRRFTVLRITAKGESYVKQQMQAMETVSALIFQQISSERKEAFVQTLEKLLDIIRMEFPGDIIWQPKK